MWFCCRCHFRLCSRVSWPEQHLLERQLCSQARKTSERVAEAQTDWMVNTQLLIELACSLCLLPIFIPNVLTGPLLSLSLFTILQSECPIRLLNVTFPSSSLHLSTYRQETRINLCKLKLIFLLLYPALIELTRKRRRKRQLDKLSSFVNIQLINWLTQQHLSRSKTITTPWRHTVYFI